MSKKINDTVKVKRKFRVDATGLMEIRTLTVHISERRENEIIYCHECDEVVKYHKASKKHPAHYEHFARGGNPCSFKTT